jgi:peptidylprolyl isomerase
VKTLLASLVLAFVAAIAPASAQQSNDPANTLVIEVKGGPVVIRLRPDLAPKHVERVKQLARDKFYDGVKFHRVIAGFMAQTGDPTGTGTGKSKYPNLPAEFTQTPFTRGTVGAARSNDPNSANSQFFICFAPTSHLNGQYTVWGQVVEGMEHIDALKKGAPGSGEVSNPDVMQKVYILGDVKR